jgi:hypothetical protein
MKRVEMDAVVREDRRHIGYGEHDAPQKFLRDLYQKVWS